jgi:hypothetical protein
LSVSSFDIDPFRDGGPESDVIDTWISVQIDRIGLSKTHANGSILLSAADLEKSESLSNRKIDNNFGIMYSRHFSLDFAVGIRSDTLLCFFPCTGVCR